MTLSLTEGSAAISGLTIANPDGWSRNHAIALEGIEVAIDLTSLDKPVIVINKVNVGQTVMRLELAEDGSSNMDDLLAGISSGGGETTEEPASGASPDLNIKTLSFSGADVNVFADTPEGPEEQAIAIPGINMSNVQGSASEISAAIGKELDVGGYCSRGQRRPEQSGGAGKRESWRKAAKNKLKGD